MDSPFNEQHDQLLMLANAEYIDAVNYLRDSKLASIVKSHNMSTRKDHKNSSRKSHSRRKVYVVDTNDRKLFACQTQLLKFAFNWNVPKFIKHYFHGQS